MRSSTASPQLAPTRRAAVVTSVVALVVGVLDSIAGAFFWATTAMSPSEDPLVAVGYVFAVMVGVPGVLGILLGGSGWWLANRAAGLVLGVLGVVAAGGPVLLLLWFLAPSF